MVKNKALRARVRPYSDRQVGVIEIISRFLIVCEGERTEPNYFKSFRVPTRPDVAIVVQGTGYNTLTLVREAIRLRLERRYDSEDDQVWCVFDRDSFPVASFNEAISLAKHEGIKVAYSNEAFELWYLLHFNFLKSGISRADYIKRLSNNLGKRYEKNSEDMYDTLASRQDTAIRNAKKLLREYDSPRPSEDNPSTTVHLLVEELRRFSR